MQPDGSRALRLALAIERSTRSLPSLIDAGRRRIEAPPTEAIRDATARGWFRPQDDEILLNWFSRFLTVRTGCWECLSELIGAYDGDLETLFTAPPPSAAGPASDEESDRWGGFFLGYAAACGVVALDRFLLEELAVDSLTQRKLNEGCGARRIPRKVYTGIFESFTDPSTALLMDQAINAKRRARRAAEAAARDPRISPMVERLPWLEGFLDRSKRRFLRRFLRFQTHALRRRAATIRSHGLFSILESSGRMVAEIRDPWRSSRVPRHLPQIELLLRPGDVLVTRHDYALTNLFLPGFWPHAALYVGDERDRLRLGVEVDPVRTQRWSGDLRVLEALKDGVRFRPLEETLGVDAVAVIRPNLSPSAVAEGLGRATRHEGKGYNFDFDFFRSDRLVCTEVVYRAFDGLEGLEIPLVERAGRPTLAAEGLLDLALDSDHFEVVAVLGAEPSPEVLHLGADAPKALHGSYRAG
ncbi:MAG: YiiX/YebB-like N1pC/P60 family cysteine hydrolase [Acidobacteriota bacterium]